MVHQARRSCVQGGLIIYIHIELEHTVLSEIDIQQLNGSVYLYKL